MQMLYSDRVSAFFTMFPKEPDLEVLSVLSGNRAKSRWPDSQSPPTATSASFAQLHRATHIET